MKKYLPSKKFTLIVGTAIAVCFVVFILTPLIFKGGVKEYVVVDQDEFASETPSDMLLLDSDNDGLYDWEEILWGTDPVNPDTNGDGVLDGQEITARRKALQEESGQIDTNETFTYTDALAQQMFLFVATNPNIDSVNLNAFADAITSDVFRLEIFNFLESSSLVTDTSVSVQEYHKNVFNTLSELRTLEHDLLIIEPYMMFEGDEMYRQKMIDQIDAYKKILNDFLEVPVFQGAEQLHLNIANSFVQTITILEIVLFNVFNDPVIALSAINQYDQVNTNFLNNINMLTQFFIQTGVVYN